VKGAQAASQKERTWKSSISAIRFVDRTRNIPFPALGCETERQKEILILHSLLAGQVACIRTYDWSGRATD
jgi:hypothetical protein